MLQVNAQLAKIIGINEAIVIQQIQYWIDRESGRVIDGARWIYNSIKDWQEQFTWLSPWQVRKAFYRLRHEFKLLKFEKMESKQWNQTGWYTIDYELLKALLISNCAVVTNQCEDSPHIKVRTVRKSNTKITSLITTKITLFLMKEGERIFGEPETPPVSSASVSEKTETSLRQQDPDSGQSSAAAKTGEIKRPINFYKGSYRSIASDPWMVDAYNSDPTFTEWVFKKKTAEGSKTASLPNAAAEIKNDFSRAKMLWDEYQEENRRREQVKAIGKPRYANASQPVTPVPKLVEKPISVIDQIKNRYLPLLKFPAMKKKAIASIQNLLSRCSESERTEINLIPEMRSLAI